MKFMNLSSFMHQLVRHLNIELIFEANPMRMDLNCFVVDLQLLISLRQSFPGFYRHLIDIFDI